MRLLICFVILALCLPLLAGTFIPLSSFEDASITDFDMVIKWGTLLNLGNCVYEPDLWYDGGIDDKAIRIPQVHIHKGLTKDLQIGLQAFSLGRHDNQALFVSLDIKRRLSKSEALSVAIDPLIGYSRNRFSPRYESAAPYWAQPDGAKQDSQAFFAQLPLLLQFNNPAINCGAKIGYARYEAKAHYMVTKPNLATSWHNTEYGPHDIIHGGINVSFPIRFIGIVIRPELGYEIFSLVEHDDKISSSLTGGLAFSFDWAQP